MQIRNIIIHRSATIRKRLIKHINEQESEIWQKVFQIYQCRVFGFCIYRSTISDKKMNEILKRVSVAALEDKHKDACTFDMEY